MKGNIHGYPKIYNLGHPQIADLLKDPVIVEEKIDGSQFSFTRIGDEVFCRSRGQAIQADAPGMFALGVATARTLGEMLHEGWTYRGEFLAKPKHNTLAYDRVPRQNFILFDVERGDNNFLNREEKESEAVRLGLEIVPFIASEMPSMDALKSLLETVSVLGGQKIEGVVIKNYSRFGKDGKALMGKFVSEEFKETHRTDWKDRNPTQGDIVELLGQSLRTPARWEKAVQHLKEAGKYEGSVRDIGNLIKELQRDLTEECGEEIKEALMKLAIPKIQRIVVRGFPEWFKDKLAGQQFEPKKVP